jgi:putative beta-lysine N-acetyltransferase
MQDTMERVGGSVIQHDRGSSRVYLMHAQRDRADWLSGRLEAIARANRYTKIFARVPESCGSPFLDQGYAVEARVPRLYYGVEDGLFLAKYIDPLRQQDSDQQARGELLDRIAAQLAEPFVAEPLGPAWAIRQLAPADAGHAASLFRLVYEAYPFPIFNEQYLMRSMRANVRYYGAFHDLTLSSLASAELDLRNQNAELTDFATLPEHTERQLLHHLLAVMEEVVRPLGVRTCYTIIRALSAELNLAFARRGYQYAGTLHNNTNVGAGIESMNVWYKHL